MTPEEERLVHQQQIERNMIRCRALMVCCVYCTAIALLVTLFVLLWRGRVLSLWALLSASLFVLAMVFYLLGERMLRLHQASMKEP